MKKIFLLVLVIASIYGFSQQISFQTIKIKDMGFVLLPSNMEVQSGILREITQQYLANVGLYSHEISGDRIVFQQKGVNIGEGRETYARVIIRTHKGRYNDYPQLDSKTQHSQKELKEYSNQFKADAFSNPSVRLVKWHGAENVYLNGKYNGTKISYTRQIRNNPPVFTSIYQIYNNDRLHVLNFSYREKDKNYWEPVFNQMIENIFIIKR